jgi:hypothetical protein
MENAKSDALRSPTARTAGFFTDDEALALEAAMGRIFPDDELVQGRSKSARSFVWIAP